jgi:hypothetical protein
MFWWYLWRFKDASSRRRILEKILQVLKLLEHLGFKLALVSTYEMERGKRQIWKINGENPTSYLLQAKFVSQSVEEDTQFPPE